MAGLNVQLILDVKGCNWPVR